MSEQDAIEILAKFARQSGPDAPRGTLHVEGQPPLSFAGWLDLMAIVERLLTEANTPGLRWPGDERQ